MLDVRRRPDSASPPATLGGRTTVLNSAANALRTLEYLIEREEAGVSEVGRHLGVTVGTGHRLVVTLVELGFAEQNPDTRRYRASGKILSLAQQMRARVNVRDRVHLHLVELMQVVRETVHLAVLDDDLVLYIDKVASDQPFGVEFRVGSRLPVHCTALGKALVAFDDKPDVAAYLHASATSGHDTPTTTAKKLLTQLRTVRDAGVAEDRGKYLPDVACVAAPIRAADGSVIAAVDVAVPRSRFDDTRAQLRLEVQRSAERISEQLHQLGVDSLST